MKTGVAYFDIVIESVVNSRHLLIPATLLGLVAVLVVPLSPFLLDIFLAANISLAAVILLTTVYTKSPLDFSVFPALLLITTLIRLVLNVASTRLILTADAATPEEGSAMAGHVIEAFGTFVAGSSLIVGGIIFLILVVVQFVVVTKGATRMSEVAARFTLDAMPGRQMAIDADLSAGLIDEKIATNRRDRVLREADFYGAMDGASKFVRGDAIAGLVIIMINIIAGFAVGIAVKGWTIPETAMLFTRLTIGDGLVSQIPAFLIAIAAGLIVARAGNRTPLGIEIPRQLVSQPAALRLVAAFLVALSFTPLPTFPLLLLAVVLVVLASVCSKNQDEESLEEILPLDDKLLQEPQSGITGTGILQLELGAGLLTLASGDRNENLVDSMASLRTSIAAELGFVIPPIRIQDNLKLHSNSYCIRLRGGVVGEGAAHKDRFMVVVGEETVGDLEGIREREPVFGFSAIWVTPEARDNLGELFVQAMSPVSVLMTHISHVTKHYAAELLSREHVSNMIEILRSTSPRLVDETMDHSLTVSRLHSVLKALLDEQVPIKDLDVIIESAADHRELSLEDCVEKVRCSLRRQICANVSTTGSSGIQVIRCIVVPDELEDAVSNKTISKESLNAAVHHAALPLTAEGLPIVVVSSIAVRRYLHTCTANDKEDVVVLSKDEIVPEVDLQIIGSVDVMMQSSKPS